MLKTSKITPDASAIKQVAKHVWELALESQQRPLIIMSTAGPALALRRELESIRPENLPPSLAFLPEIHGVNQWLEETPGLLDIPVALNNLRRWEIVYEALEDWPRIREQLGGIGFGGRWALARAIVLACDKLSASNLFPPYDETANSDELLEKAQQLFEAALEEAYPLLAGQLINIDAKLVMAFWKNLSSLSDPIPRRQLAYELRGRDACHPLIWLELAEPAAFERSLSSQFLTRYAQKYPVVSIDVDWKAAALWPESLGDESAHINKELISSTINANRSAVDSKSWQILGLKRFEDVAWMAARRIEEHLIAGRENVALIAQDRLVARRVRALLARLGPGLSVQDETGWKLVTTRAAAAVHDWLAIVRSSSGPSVMELMAFFKSPLFDINFFEGLLGVNQDVPNEIKANSRTQALLWAIEKRLLKYEVKAGWTSIIGCFDRDDNDEALEIDSNNLESLYSLSNCRSILVYLQNLSKAWYGLKKTSSLWADHLLSDLDKLGMTQLLVADEAGRQYVQCVESMASVDQTQLSLNSWMALLDLWIEESSYLEKAISGVAKITVLPLSGMRLRTFDAVVMVGCDDKQLPSFSDAGLFFSDQLMSALSIRGIHEEFVQQSRDLSQMLVSHRYVDLIWQTMGSSQSENRLSSWLVRLDKQLHISHQSSASLPMANAHHVDIIQSKATWDGGQYQLPVSVSPSAYKLLRDCPYKFYVNRLLGLRTLDGLEIESDSSLIGTLLHRILKNFYKEVQIQDVQNSLDLTQLNDDQRSDRYQVLLGLLGNISLKAFSKLIQGNGKYISYWLDWQSQMPSWVDWQLKREAAGWQFHNAEVKVGFDLVLDDGAQIRIEGNADRLDIHAKEGASVLDYKFQSPKKIEKKSAYIADDPQLLIYAKAVNQTMEVEEKNVTAVEWVALKQDKSDLKKNRPRFDYPLEDFSTLYDNFLQGVSRDLSQVWAGNPMQADAPDSVCQFCDVRGICRKGMWSRSV